MAMFYGTLFMMAGAYTLAANGHVRGDVLYGFFTPRVQASLDLTLYILFFIPGVVALVYAGYYYAADSWRINEHSNVTADGPPIYPFKTVIPIAGAILLAAGHRRDRALRDLHQAGRVAVAAAGREEVDVDKLKEMVHVKDEDIQALDALVVQQGARQVRMRRELWFGFGLMAIILAAIVDIHAAGRNLPERPPRAAHAGADRRGDHARLPDRVHADGHGRVLRVARLPQRQSRSSRLRRCSTSWCSARSA